jgi:hypothetical protein
MERPRKVKKLDDVSLSTKLWVTYAVLLAAMAGVGLWLQYSANRAHEVAAQRTRAADDLITLATTWKTMSSANTAATLASLMSTEPQVVQFFGDRLKAGIAASSEMQKRIQELATTDADKKAFEDIATRRAVVLGLVKKNQELKKSGAQAELMATIEKDFLPAVTAYEAAQGELAAVQVRQRDDIQRDADAAVARSGVIGLLSVLAVLAAGRRKSPRATRTCLRAPSRRHRPCSRRRPRWSTCRPRCARRPRRPTRPSRWPMARWHMRRARAATPSDDVVQTMATIDTQAKQDRRHHRRHRRHRLPDQHPGAPAGPPAPSPVRPRRRAGRPACRRSSCCRRSCRSGHGRTG